MEDDYDDNDVGDYKAYVVMMMIIIIPIIIMKIGI